MAVVDVLHQHRLRHLEHERRGGHVEPLQRARHLVDEGRGAQLPGRDVDGHGHPVPAVRGSAPPGEGGARRLQDPSSDRQDQAAVLGDRDEAVGAQQAEDRVLPPHQGLQSDDVAGLQVDHRLVDESQLVLRHGGGQVELEPQALVGRGLHPGLEHHGTATPRGLGLVHGDVRVAQHRGGRVLLAQHGDADAGGGDDGPVPQAQGCGQGLKDPGGDGLGLVGGVPRGLQQHGELVPAEPGDGVTGPHQVDQAGGHLAQQLVAGVVSEAVVDRLEAVEVQVEHDRRGCAPPPPPHGVVEPFAEEHPVGEPGQRVVQRLSGQLLLRLLAGGHVEQVDDDAADGRVLDQAHGAGLDPGGTTGAVQRPLVDHHLTGLGQRVPEQPVQAVRIVAAHAPCEVRGGCLVGAHEAVEQRGDPLDLAQWRAAG